MAPSSAIPNLLVVLGPTASGKTALAVEAAKLLNGEIISADSRQVYRGMDLGTGKDLQEYGHVPYHLIDIVDPGHEFNLFAFQHHFDSAFHQIRQRGCLPILCGGSGLYLDAVLSGYVLTEAPPDPALRAELEQENLDVLRRRLLALQPQQHNRTDLEDRERLIRAIEIARAQNSAPPPAPRPELVPLIFGIHWPRPQLRQRIVKRLRQRLDQGMVAEVEQLHTQGVSWTTLEFYGLEYRFIAQYLQQQLNYNDMVQKLASAIQQFAKRQDTWFRRMERQGTCIHWLDGTQQPLQQMMALIRQQPGVDG
ncbi:MAG: tRNA (adenosine(37)-N6)-dimethylallyltransferase MiaA [Desulfuromonadaceae bacterium]|nr:tRNA (adenosine(37)-N6)-dimethylallyltransferase MiaA [Desulfuromonadaceae bacterium]